MKRSLTDLILDKWLDRIIDWLDIAITIVAIPVACWMIYKAVLIFGRMP